jgi:hypothetical protein
MSLTADRRSTTPFIDAHSTDVAAPVDEVARALLGSLERSFSKSSAVAYARLVGCADSRASGPRPVTTGSTIPGFRVTSTVPAKELVLEGQHRFASYVLTFDLVELGTGRSRLRAETRARFRHGAVWPA